MYVNFLQTFSNNNYVNSYVVWVYLYAYVYIHLSHMYVCPYTHTHTHTYFPPVVQEPLMSQGLLIIKALRSHSDTPHSVGLFWTSDQPDSKTSTWQHTTLTTDKYPCPWRDSNPRSQQASGRRPTPSTARLLGPASVWCDEWNVHVCVFVTVYVIIYFLNYRSLKAYALAPWEFAFFHY